MTGDRTRTSSNGVDLSWITTGPAASGRTMLWGHGLSSNIARDAELGLVDWDAVASAGAAEVVSYDARGHGESDFTDSSPDYDWPALADDQFALADALGLDTHVSGGASMGCATALHAAVARPDRIDALVLMIPPTAWETRQAQTQTYLDGAGYLEAKGIGAYARAQAARPTLPVFADRPEIFEANQRHLHLWDPARLATILRGAATADFPSREQIMSITVPTLIVAWSDDPAHPESTAEQLDELIPNSSLHIAHTWDELGQWTTHIADFLGAL